MSPAAPNNTRLIAELQAVTLGINLVGLDRLPEVMRDGAAPAQTQDIATMTDTNTVHGGAVALEDALDAWIVEGLRSADRRIAGIRPVGCSGMTQEDVDAGRVEAYQIGYQNGVKATLTDASFVIARSHPTPQADTDAREKVVGALEDCWGALNFILAFYEPGQRHLDTNAWKNAEAGGRRAHKQAGAILAALKTGDA